MAKDDYYVLVYKILKHLEDCLKSSTPPNWNELQPNTKKFPIDDEYWNYIWLNLYKDGYVTGVLEVEFLGADPQIQITDSLKITPKGIQYLSENSMLAKAKGYIKGAAELVTTVKSVL